MKKEAKKSFFNKKKAFVLIALAVVISAVAVAVPAAGQKKEDRAAGAEAEWKLVVDINDNVTTAYRRTSGENWEPVRTMLCSTGINGHRTPELKTPLMQERWEWCLMTGGLTYGRCAVRIKGHVMFHSIPYAVKGNKASLPAQRYRNLGSPDSLGCVSLPYIDIKWIYDNCPAGTIVELSRSAGLSSLGMPGKAPLNVSTEYCFDPTDPDPANTNYSAKAPVIRLVKRQVWLRRGQTWDPAKNASAVDTRTRQDLSDLVTYTIYRKSTGPNGGTVWLLADGINTFDRGAVYKVVYSCYYEYCSRYTSRTAAFVRIR